MKTFKKDNLSVIVADTRDDMGACAAKDIATTLINLQKQKDEINIIFAAAPSQNETLKYLIESSGIDWTKINAFHMDEYIGLPSSSNAKFSSYLNEHIFSHLPFKSVNYICSDTNDMDSECNRYTELLKKHPIDIVILGVGENGHIAFNDPPVADFNDTRFIKPVKLDDICRNQQVNDGCFATIDDVPQYALTLTIPVLTSAKYMFCSVPSKTKATAIKEMLTCDKIDEHCPASVLRLHANATLYCDLDSASMLEL